MNIEEAKKYFTEDYAIYRITEDIDLEGQEFYLPMSCVLDFQGGCIKNGILRTNYTRLLNVVGPVGIAASRYITATIKGPNGDNPSWAAGQLIYNANNGNMEMYNSSSKVVDFYGDPMNHYGNTASRPVGDFLTAGFVYFDTTLNKPIFYKSAGVWVDATGSQV